MVHTPPTLRHPGCAWEKSEEWLIKSPPGTRSHGAQTVKAAKL